MAWSRLCDWWGDQKKLADSISSWFSHLGRKSAPIANEKTTPMINGSTVKTVPELFILKTEGSIAPDGTVTLDTNGLGKPLPTQRNKEILEKIRKRYIGSTGELPEDYLKKLYEAIGGEEILADMTFAVTFDPRNSNVFYDSKEAAAEMSRVAAFLNQLDQDYIKEKTTQKL